MRPTHVAKTKWSHRSAGTARAHHSVMDIDPVCNALCSLCHLLAVLLLYIEKFQLVHTLQETIVRPWPLLKAVEAAFQLKGSRVLLLIDLVAL